MYHGVADSVGHMTLAGQSANLMFGRIYDSHVVRDPVTMLAKTCTLGRGCYVEAFHVTTGMTAAAVVVAIVLGRRRTMQR